MLNRIIIVCLCLTSGGCLLKGADTKTTLQPVTVENHVTFVDQPGINGRQNTRILLVNNLNPPSVKGSGTDRPLGYALATMLPGWELIAPDRELLQSLRLSWNNGDRLISTLSQSETQGKTIKFVVDTQKKAIVVEEITKEYNHASCIAKAEKNEAAYRPDQKHLYHLKSTETLEQNLRRWTSSHINLDWRFPDDLTVESNLTFCGTLKDVVKQLGKALYDSHFPVVLAFNESVQGSTLVVEGAQ